MRKELHNGDVRRKEARKAVLGPPPAAPTGTAKIRQQLTRKATLIPVAIIVLLGSGLIARDAIYTWVDWNYRTGNPHAELVPDSADLMVTIDLSRLRDPEVIDALNGWRQDATKNGASKDISAALKDWTGREFSDSEIGAWAGRRITLMSGPWGAAIAIDARSTERALEWLERGANERWIGWLDEGVVWLAQEGATEKIEETKGYGLRTSIATTADYRRAREAHELLGGQAEIFVRWRQMNEPWKERLTSALDCAPDGWISTRVRAEEDGLKVESICRPPARAWRARTLAEAGAKRLTIPGAMAAWVATTHPTDWHRVKERIEESSPGAAELAAALEETLENEGDGRELLGLTSGVTTFGWDSSEGRLHAATRLAPDGENEATEALDRLAERLAGKWGAEAARKREDGTYQLADGLWGGSAIEVTISDGTIQLNRPSDETATREEVEPDAITVVGWTQEGAGLVSRWLGGTAGTWGQQLGPGRAVRTADRGLTIHRAEVEWRD